MKENNNIEVSRLDIWIADLGNTKGSVLSGIRPILIVSNQKCNEVSPIVQYIPITSNKLSGKLTTHTTLKANDLGFEIDSTLIAEQVGTIDRRFLISIIAKASKTMLPIIEEILRISRTIDRKVESLEIWNADLSGNRGSVQSGRYRTILVVLEENHNFNFVKYVPLTKISDKPKEKQERMKRQPTHLFVPSEGTILKEDSILLFESTGVLDKTNLHFKIGDLPLSYKKDIDYRNKNSFGLK